MPLTDPVPSSSFDVLERNVQDADKFVNQETGTFTNRVGKVIKPIPVIEAEANAAVISLGWHQVGFFADGFTYALQNDIAKDATGDWYRWNGALPKIVTAGTLPSSDANFVKIDYKSHADLSDLNVAGGHDQIYDRSFQSVDEMIYFSGLTVGRRYSTGGTSWKYIGFSSGTIADFEPLSRIYMNDWGDFSVGNNSVLAQQCLDEVGLLGGAEVVLPQGVTILNALIVRHENIHIVGHENGTTVLNPDDFTTGHQPTIWLSKSNCSVKGVKFSYVDWDSVNLTSLLTTRPSVSSYYGNHIAVNFTELYTSANSGIPLVFRGETLGVVYNVEIIGCEVIGAALHGFAAFNTIGIKVNNNKIREFKGTGFLAFICGNIEFNKNNLKSSKDDGVYISNYSTHLDGVWTPLTQNDMINVIINSNVMNKIGAKYIGVSGYINVMIDGNYLIECRSSPILVGTESSTSGTGCGDVIITNNVIKDAFGAFGLPSDGYGYSSDIASSVGGTYHVFDVRDTSNIDINSNIVKISSKVVSNSYRAGRFEVCDTVSFCANTLYDIIKYGLIFGAYGNVLAASSKCFVTSNTFRHRDAVSGMRIVVSADGSQVNIRLNSFYSNDSYSNTWAFIDTSNPNYTGISNNTFYNPNGASEIRTLDGIGSNIQISDNQSTARTQGRELNNILNSVTWGTVVPTGGYYSQGDVIFNKNVVAGGFCGWICVATGTPGTWKTFGAISA